MKKVVVLKPIDRTDKGRVYTNRHLYMFQPFVDTIYNGIIENYGTEIQVDLHEIETGWRWDKRGRWSEKDSRKTRDKIFESLNSGDILIIIGLWSCPWYNFAEYKKRGIKTIVYETEPLGRLWKKVYYFQGLDEKDCPDEVWTYCYYNVWNYTCRKITNKLKLRVVYPGYIDNSPTIKQTSSTQFLMMSSMYDPNYATRRAIVGHHNNKSEFFRDNQFKIEWWDDKSFIDTYNDNLDKVSGITANILKSSNLKKGKHRKFHQPFNSASIIRYVGFGVLVVSDQINQRSSVCGEDVEKFKDLVDFCHIHNLSSKLENITNIPADERQKVADTRLNILKERFSAKDCLKDVDLI